MDICSRIWISKFQFQNFGSLMHMGLVLSSVQNFKLIWLWTIFVTNCFKFLVIWMMACYFPFWCMSNCDVCVLTKKIKKIFSCVLHTANTLTCFERSFFLYTKKNIGSFENVFSHGFLKHQNCFSCISGFYNMFVKLQRVLANIPKNIKILFWGEFIYYSPLMFG